MEINNNENITAQSHQPPSLSGNAAAYQNGGKRRTKKSKKTVKRSKPSKQSKTIKRKTVKKCWWKFF